MPIDYLARLTTAIKTLIEQQDTETAQAYQNRMSLSSNKITATKQKELIRKTIEIIKLLKIARIYFYENKTPTDQDFFEKINKKANELYEKPFFQKYANITPAKPPADPQEKVYTDDEIFNPHFIDNWYSLTVRSTFRPDSYQAYRKKYIDDVRKDLEIKQLKAINEKYKEQNEALKLQEEKNKQLTIDDIIQSIKILEQQLITLKIADDNEFKAKASQLNDSDSDAHVFIDSQITAEQKIAYIKAKAAHKTSNLDKWNDFAGAIMLAAYGVGSIGTSFFLITYKYDKEHFRLEEFNKIEDHHFHITDFDICFATSLFLLWNIIDAVSILIDAANDFENKDNRWGLINTLNGIQLLGFSVLGYYVSEHEKEITFDKLDITIAAEDVAQLGLSIAAFSFAICMFTCSYVASLKQEEAMNLINKLEESKIAGNQRLSEVPNNQDIIKRIDVIRKTRVDDKYSDILTCYLTAKQARAILQIEATCQQKAKTAWFRCGVVMTLIFISSLPLSFGAAAPVLATVIMMGLLWNCINRYQLKQAGKLSGEMIKDVINDKNIEKTKDFYSTIDSGYNNMKTCTYWSSCKMGINKNTEKNSAMGLLNDKYVCAPA